MFRRGKKRKAEEAKREQEKREADARAASAAAARPVESPAAISVELSAPTSNGGPVAAAPAPDLAAEGSVESPAVASVGLPAPTGNGGPVAAAPASGLAAEAETEIAMCQKLQEALGRPVFLVKEPLKDRAWHTAIKHQRPAYGLGMLGLVIATALTHGTAPLVLTACSGSIPLLDFNTFFDKKKVAYNKGVVLDQAAIDALLKIISASERAGIAQAAIDVKGSVGGRVTLTGADIGEAVAAANAAKQAALDTDAGPGPVQIGVRMGLAVFGSGLLLLALAIIPEDIHTLMTRVASLILVVGVLIIGGALANGGWLKGPVSPPPSSPWPTAPPDPAIRELPSVTESETRH